MNTKEAPKHSKGNTSLLGHTRENDNVDHINIWSRGKSELGRLLSHFNHQPFVHPHYGPFYSMEGLWYFARAGFNEKLTNRLRYLSGYRAKKLGRQFPYVKHDHFKEVIIAANYQKIIQNENLMKLMRDSELPFDHYYTFGDTDGKDEGENLQHITPNNSDWLIEGFEEIRRALQADVEPQSWINANARFHAPK